MIQKKDGAITYMAHETNAISRQDTVRGMRVMGDVKARIYDAKHIKQVEELGR